MPDQPLPNVATQKQGVPARKAKPPVQQEKKSWVSRFMGWLRGVGGLDEGQGAVGGDAAAPTGTLKAGDSAGLGSLNGVGYDKARDALSPGPVPSDEPKVRVKPGDTLASLAGRYLGDAQAWVAIYEANRATIKNPDVLTPGQILIIPGAQISTPDVVKDDELGGSGGKTAGGGAAATTGASPGVTSASKGGYTLTKEDSAMASGKPLAVGKTELEKEMAAIYNTKGTLVKAEADRLGVEPAVGGAVLSVESDGSGHVGGRLTIRFEPAVFRRESGKSFSMRRGGQDGEYKALEAAIAIDEDAAYKSVSMGAGQIMGFNAQGIGYGSAREMFDEFQRSQKAQLVGVFEFIRVTRVVLKAAKAKDWATFAKHYNGPGYKANAYDTKLKNSYDTWKRVTKGLPNA